MSCLVSISWLVAVILLVAIPCAKLLSNEGLLAFSTQIPKLRFVDGRANIDRVCPYTITDNNGKALMLFDLANASTLDQSAPPIVMHQDSIVVHIPGTRPISYRFIRQANFELDLNSIGSSLKQLVIWLPFIYILVGTPIVVFLHWCQMFIYGLMAWLMAKLCHREVKLKAGLRLAAMAMTPAIVASTAVVIALFTFFPFRLVHLLIVYAPVHSWAVHHPLAIASVASAFGYLVFAIYSLQVESDRG